MDTETYLTLLPKLGIAIDNSLTAWEAYIAEVRQQEDFTTIISSESDDSATKAKALQHILFTLPLRHEALVKSWGDPKLRSVELSETCDRLLAQLMKYPDGTELNACYDEVIASKRFIDRVVAVEEETRECEDRRSQVLRSLKAVHINLMEVRGDGELGAGDIVALVDAMEAVGVSLVGLEGFEVREDS